MNYRRELDLTVDRLRRLPTVRLARHEQAVYAVLDAMTPRAVPRLSPPAWGDQLAVIGRECDDEALAPMLRQLRRGFDLTLDGVASGDQ